VEAPSIGRLVRRWRVRLTLVAQGRGQTRLRCRVSYEPASVVAKLIDGAYLRRAIADGVEGALAGIAAAFRIPVTAARLPVADPASETNPPLAA
jgi:hypothetical protein